jgi:hypothetical protein
MSDPVTPIAAVSVAVAYLAKTVYEYVKPKNGSVVNGRLCVLSNADSAKLRNIEIGDHVVDMLEPTLKEQVKLLGEIRDAVRDQSRRN